MTHGKNRIFAAILLICMIFCLISGCKKETIDAARAQEIVLEELGLHKVQADPHVHVGEHEGKPCFIVYVTVGDVQMEYRVDSETGEILYAGKTDHSHDHSH